MIGLLLRCYPARWRARYGDEFEALLQERTLGPFDVADVLLGALDARLHLRGRDPALDHGRGFPMTLRIGGLAAIVGGFLWFIFFAANAINNGADTVSAWLGLLAIAATLVTLVALVGLSAFEARREPLLAWAAFTLPAGSAVVSMVGWIAMAANGDSDHPVVGDLSAWALMSFGLIGLLAGSGLFALAALRTRNLSRPAAALLGVGALLVVPALAGASGGVGPPVLSAILLIGSILAFSAGWAGLGVSALRVRGPAPTSMGRASV